jgi:hypothetical protein
LKRLSETPEVKAGQWVKITYAEASVVEDRLEVHGFPEGAGFDIVLKL